MYGKYKNRKRRAPVRRSVKSVRRVYKKAITAVKKRRFAKAVKRVINKAAETKVVNFYGPNRGVLNVRSANWDSQILNLLPQASGTTGVMYTIAQGDLQSDRNGNQVQPTGLYISGVIRTNTGYNESSNYNPCPLRVCLWVVKMKPHLNDDIATLEGVVGNSFFENGSTSIGMDGTNMDLVRIPNKSQVTVLYKRVFKVGMGNYVSAFATNGPNNVNQQFNNNDSSVSQMFKINLSKYLPKKLVYNDGTNVPTNTRKMWLFYTCHRVDNTIPVTNFGVETGPIPAYVDLQAQLSYKDY